MASRVRGNAQDGGRGYDPYQSDDGYPSSSGSSRRTRDIGGIFFGVSQGNRYDNDGGVSDAYYRTSDESIQEGTRRSAPPEEEDDEEAAHPYHLAGGKMHIAANPSAMNGVCGGKAMPVGSIGGRVGDVAYDAGVWSVAQIGRAHV